MSQAKGGEPRQGVDAHVRHCAVGERFGGRYKRTVATLRTHLGAPAPVDEAIARWSACAAS